LYKGSALAGIGSCSGTAHSQHYVSLSRGKNRLSDANTFHAPLAWLTLTQGIFQIVSEQSVKSIAVEELTADKRSKTKTVCELPVARQIK
jgi:hypothetical protein